MTHRLRQWRPRLAAGRVAALAGCVACAALAMQALAARPPAATGAAQADNTVSVVVELAAPSALALLAELPPPAGQATAAQAAALTQAQVVAVDQAQQAMLAELAALGAQPLYRVQRVYNGIAVRVDRDRLDEVRSLPDVKAVHPLIPKLPANHVSVPGIGAPALWGGLPGVTGRGVTIAVIDTGVDYLHADLGGPGTGYASNDTMRVGDVPGFPNLKVVAGYDFAGDDYNADAEASTYQPVPRPDPDPMDCYGFGHGTHVAGTAAGYGALLDGSRYPGPYDSTAPGRAFQVGPGVAPEADVVALKVFGCQGSSEIVDLAIEWAVDPDGDGDFSDHVDVINLSLGTPLGSLDDLTSVAADNAALLGVIVVASAGNAGDTHYVISSPGVADRVISVAAVGRVLPAQLVSFSSRGPRRGDSSPKPDLAAPGDGIVSAKAGGGSHMASGTSMAAPHVAGAMALLRQLHPAASATLAQGVSTPVAGDQPWTAEELKALAMNTALYPVTTTVSSGVAPVSPVRAGAGRVDLAAAAQARVIAYSAETPGLVSVGFGTLEVLDSLSVVRNVRVANKSAMTATYSARYVPAVDLAGVAIQVASSPTVIVPPGGFATLPLLLTATAAEMDHGRDPTLSMDQWWAPRTWLSEEAGYLELTPVVDDAIPQAAAAGHLPLHVPVYAAPRPASAQLASGELDFGEADRGQALVEFTGHSLTGSAPPTSVVSLASLFELSHVSGVEADREAADGWAQPCLCADLQYVGVTVVQPAADGAGSLLAFGVATHSPWDSPHAVRFDIFIDTNLDGSADYRLYNGDAGSGGRRTFSDAFLAVLERWPSRSPVTQEYLGGVAPTVVDVGLFNTRLMLLPVRASALGLGGEITGFGYVVESYDLDDDGGAGGTLVERTPMRRYDLQRPGLRIAAGLDGSPLHRVDGGDPVSVDFERSAYQQAGTPDLLVFHYHNLDPQRAQVVPVQFVDRRTLFLPLIQR